MTKALMMLWLSDIAGSVSVIGTISLIGLVIAFLFVGLKQILDFEEGMGKSAWLYMRWLLIPVAIALVIPSASTIRLTAAVEASDALANTNLGKKGLDAANAMLDKIIKEAGK